MATLANAATWTFFSSGTILSGFDATGYFGPGDLAGKTYSQSYTLDPALYPSGAGSSSFVRYASGPLAGTATDTLTIDGVSRTFTWDLSRPGFGQVILINAFSQLGAGHPADRAAQLQSGYADDGSYLFAQSDVSSTVINSFGIALDFSQVWSHLLQPGESGTDNFSASGSNGATYFSGATTFVAINPAVSAIQEPQSSALLLAGLGLLGLLGRFRKPQQAAA